MFMWLMSLSPITRAIMAAGLGYVAIEMFKPSFAFSEAEDGSFYAKPFGSGEIVLDDDTVLGKTYLTWWSTLLLIFGVFALFV